MVINFHIYFYKNFKDEKFEDKPSKATCTEHVATPVGHPKIWAVSRQNQHSAFATSMDTDQPAHSRSLIRIHAVRYQFLYL
jgi:hypothetical protein